MVTTLGEIPTEVRYVSASDNARRWREMANTQAAPYRRNICIRRAERMERIAERMLKEA